MDNSEFKVDPTLSDSERLIRIEVLLVGALKTQDSHDKRLGRIEKAYYVALGALIVSLGSSGTALFATMSSGT